MNPQQTEDRTITYADGADLMNQIEDEALRSARPLPTEEQAKFDAALAHRQQLEIVANNLIARLDAIWRDLDHAKVVIHRAAYPFEATDTQLLSKQGYGAVIDQVLASQFALRTAVGLVAGVRDELSSHRELSA